MENNEPIANSKAIQNQIYDASYNKILQTQAYVLHELTLMVLRQTTYTYDEAKSELIKHKGNYMLVIRNDNGISDAKVEDVLSTNQETYKQIRQYMDKGSESYRLQQERNENE